MSTAHAEPECTARGTDGVPAAVFAIADDLSGAAEAAAALAMPDGRAGRVAEVHLGPPAAPSNGEVTVVDVDSRSAGHDEVRAMARGLLGALPTGVTVYAKVDSLWRGQVAATIAALLEPGHPVVFAPTLPAAARLLVGGRLMIDGVPLHESASWAIETAAPPRGVDELLAALPIAEVPLALVRSSDGSLTAAFAAAAEGDPVVLVCDAETDDDLDRIAAAAAAVPATRMVGSGGLALAIGRLLATRERSAPVPPPRPPTPGNPLFLIGTAEDGARRQIAELLRRTDAAHVRLGADEIFAGRPGLPAAQARIDAALDRRAVAVDVDPGLPVGSDIPAARAALLGTLAQLARTSGRGRDLMLTGGETARFVLDALGVTHLSPLRVLDIGTIASTAPDGRVIVTRPGSFGGADNLVLIHESLRKGI